jgi:hypothetical protein
MVLINVDEEEKDRRIFLGEEEEREEDEEDDRMSISELMAKLRNDDVKRKKQMLGTDEMGVLD